MKGLSLRGRFILLLVALSSISIAFLISYLVSHAESLLIDQTMISRKNLSRTLAVTVTNALLYEELGLIEEGGLIENYIADWMKNDEIPVDYVKVIDRNGRIIASDKLSEYGEILPPPFLDQLFTVDSIRISQPVRLTRDAVLDVAAPLTISTRSWGYLLVGYSLESLEEELLAIKIRHIVAGVSLIIMMSLIMVLYVRSAFKPLINLRDFMAEAAKQPWMRTGIKQGGEIGDLAVVFNRLLDEIEQARILERETQEKFLQTERIATVGKLAAGVAHEVRNPLSGILNLVENLERYKMDETKFKQYTALIRDGIVRIEKIVDGLVSFARQSDFNPVSIDPVKLFDETLELIAYPLRKAGIEVERDYSARVPRIQADPDQMKQVLLNILLNALKSMEESGGKLIVGIRHSEAMQVELFVEDDGIGIPRENVAKIFDPFYTTKDAGEGTGLGLAVSQSIVHRHNGRIEVWSEEGKGALFTVIIPTLQE